MGCLTILRVDKAGIETYHQDMVKDFHLPNSLTGDTLPFRGPFTQGGPLHAS